MALAQTVYQVLRDSMFELVVIILASQICLDSLMSNCTYSPLKPYAIISPYPLYSGPMFGGNSVTAVEAVKCKR